MKEFRKIWHQLKSEIRSIEIFDGFSGAFLYATLIFLPIIFMLIEAAVVFVYLLTLWVILIIIALFFYVYLLHIFWRKSLLLKKPEITADIKKIFLIQVIAVNIFILICGIIFLTVLVPILWV